MKVKTLLLLFFAALTLPVTAWSGDEGTKTIDVVGSSRIVSGNMSAARDEAVAAGLIAAVNRVLAETMPREAVLGKFHVLNDKVFSHIDEYVKDYKVLSESKAGGRYVVMVEATVTTGRLMKKLNDLGIWAEQKNMPRVLICVSEKGLNDSDYRYWWSGQPGGMQSFAGDSLTQGLDAAGYKIVRTEPKPEFSAYPALLGVTEALDLGRRAQADVVIVGQAQAEEAQAGAGAQSFRGLIELQAYAAENGRQVGQSRRSELAAGGDTSSGPRQALEHAAALAGQDLARQIETAWISQSAGIAQVEVVVAGTGGHIANFVKLRGSLSRMPGVANVQIKEMRQDAAVLAVEYQGNARSLADALLLQSFDAFGISINHVGPDKIDIQMMPR